MSTKGLSCQTPPAAPPKWKMGGITLRDPSSWKKANEMGGNAKSEAASGGTSDDNGNASIGPERTTAVPPVVGVEPDITAGDKENGTAEVTNGVLEPAGDWQAPSSLFGSGQLVDVQQNIGGASEACVRKCLEAVRFEFQVKLQEKDAQIFDLTKRVATLEEKLKETRVEYSYPIIKWKPKTKDYRGPHYIQATRDTIPEDVEFPDDLTCPECGKEFGYPQTLRQHYLKHFKSERKYFECDLCDKKFSYQTGLLGHKARKHRTEQSYPEPAADAPKNVGNLRKRAQQKKNSKIQVTAAGKGGKGRRIKMTK